MSLIVKNQIEELFGIVEKDLSNGEVVVLNRKKNGGVNNYLVTSWKSFTTSLVSSRTIPVKERTILIGTTRLEVEKEVQKYIIKNNNDKVSRN